MVRDSSDDDSDSIDPSSISITIQGIKAEVDHFN